MKNNYCTGYYQFSHELRPFSVVNYGDRLTVDGYSYSYFAFGSVAGYAAYNHENTEREIARARANHHELVWVNALASVMDCSGQTGEQKAMRGAPADAKMHNLAIGNLVWFEGQTYRLDKDHNRNVKLTPVRVHFDGTVSEGMIEED